MRSDLEHNYVPWINHALRKIQDDHDWECMLDLPEVTINQGGMSAALPADFKSLTSERYPIAVGIPGGSEKFPCSITTLAKTQRYRATTFFPPLTTTQYAGRTGIPVYLQREGDGVQLKLTAPAAETLIFSVSCYRYLPHLKEDGDQNDLTVSYEEMVEARVKARAFARVNEYAELVPAHETAYLMRLREAKATDFRRARQGRALRMGG